MNFAKLKMKTNRHANVSWLTLSLVLISQCAAAQGAPAETAVSPAAAMIVKAPDSVRQWEVLASDVTLAKTFERWAAIAGYRMKWDAARSFLIDGPNTFQGTFEDAVAGVLSTPGIRLGDYPLEACIYTNTRPLVRITRQGEQIRECEAVTSAK